VGAVLQKGVSFIKNEPVVSEAANTTPAGLVGMHCAGSCQSGPTMLTPGLLGSLLPVSECGGFFPWVSWSMFLSANARPGNGGETPPLALGMHVKTLALITPV
jgi:hypothetical protein